ncbi:MAG: Crp/Fnr family transcriptional regulator [Candidatus Saccharibacteria bacterium]
MDDRRSFYRNCPTVKFSKGETIFHQGEIPKCIYSVKSGIVEETDLTSTGFCQSVSFEIVGDIFPKGYAFSNSDSTLFYYTAYTDCVLYVINRNDFLHQINTNFEFAKKMLKRNSSLLLGARLQVDSIEKPSAKLKLLHTFKYLCLLYGIKISEDSIKILVPLTQQKIAEHTGLTRETINIELNKFMVKKIIYQKAKQYIVNIKKLNIEIEEESNSHVSVSMLPDEN